VVGYGGLARAPFGRKRAARWPGGAIRALARSASNSFVSSIVSTQTPKL
jgi:hypothetical protein